MESATYVDTITALLPIPRDCDDENYIVSFDVSEVEESKLFFDKYGFVVFRNVFSAEECLDSRNAMWETVEGSNPGVVGRDPVTWSNFKSAGSIICLRANCIHNVPLFVREVWAVFSRTCI
jgi:hypothetical protein